MNFFRRKKKLIDCDPKELDLDTLSHLQASLVAKLILVNEELIGRWQKISAFGVDLPSNNDARMTLDCNAAHLKQFNDMLQDELYKIVGEARNN